MNSFGARSTLRVGNREYEIYRIDALDKKGTRTAHLPFSLRILLENLLRTEDGRNVRRDDILALASWSPTSIPTQEIAFTPARVLMQDFTGVPAIVDHNRIAVVFSGRGIRLDEGPARVGRSGGRTRIVSHTL